MGTTSPARIDDGVYASAKLAGEVHGRSAAQQIAHWARLGRELEASPSLAIQRVAEVLRSNPIAYDELDAEEQAVVRQEWQARIDLRLQALDLAVEFDAEGRVTATELDDDGNVVQIPVSGG